jgi:hypothetical protein
LPDRKLLIASVGDNAYFHLIRDMVLSVRAHERNVAIGILDLGFEPAQRNWLAEHVEHLVIPSWDIVASHQERTPKVVKAAMARAFLPRHFPGYEMYVYIASDAWLQRWQTVELYCAAAGRERIAITPELDRAYKHDMRLFGITRAWKMYRKAFGWPTANRLGHNPLVNCGAFALHHDAPHWAAWQRVLKRVLQRDRFFAADQIAMNYLIYGDHMPANFLPAYCNWMPGNAPPAFDSTRGFFVEPYPPNEPIGIMHLAGTDAKNQVFRLATLRGRTIETMLRYSESRTLGVLREIGPRPLHKVIIHQ